MPCATVGKMKPNVSDTRLAYTFPVVVDPVNDNLETKSFPRIASAT